MNAKIGQHCMKKILLLITLGVLSNLSNAENAPAPEAASTSPFKPDLSFKAALKQAEAEHKIVLVDFFTTWCGPCKLLDKNTWHDSAVLALLGEKTIPLKIDAEKENALAKQYGVNSYPTIALIRPDGTLLDSLVGYREPAKFCIELRGELAGTTQLAQAQKAVEKAPADSEDYVEARYNLGQELARKGENSAALTEFLWCFDVGMKKQQGFEGVRISFLLQDLARLGAHYPPALDALRERRDAAQKLLSSVEHAGAEFGAINNYLGEKARNLEAFDQAGTNASLKAALGYWVFDQLLEQKRYEDALSAQPLAKYEELFTRMSSAKIPREQLSPILAGSAGKELEALAGAGRLEDARNLMEQVLQFDHSEATLGELRKHLERAGHLELVAK